MGLGKPEIWILVWILKPLGTYSLAQIPQNKEEQYMSQVKHVYGSFVTQATR